MVNEQSEARLSKSVCVANNWVNHISRVDRCWSLTYSSQRYTFAILEFKAPRTIVQNQWINTLGEAVGDARKICRQLKKYCYAYNTRYGAVCDGFILLELYLQDQMDTWVASQIDTAPLTRARFRWIDDRSEMKREWFVFLRMALREKLCEIGVAV